MTLLESALYHLDLAHTLERFARFQHRDRLPQYLADIASARAKSRELAALAHAQQERVAA